MANRAAHQMFTSRYTYWKKFLMYQKRDIIYTRIFFYENNQIVLYKFVGDAEPMDPNVD